MNKIFSQQRTLTIEQDQKIRQQQSLIAGALDDDNYVALASLDLSAAFDIVDVGLLLKRLQINKIPKPDF